MEFLLFFSLIITIAILIGAVINNRKYVVAKIIETSIEFSKEDSEYNYYFQTVYEYENKKKVKKIKVTASTYQKFKIGDFITIQD